MAESEPPRIEAIDRALSLLLAMAEAGPDGGQLAELAEKAGANKSTAYRALSTMKSRGFAVQYDTTGCYALGPVAMHLAARSFTPENLARSLHPALVALSQRANELVHLGVQSGHQVMYVDKVEPARAIRVWSSIGQLAPLATTAMGRALLSVADASPEQLATYLIHLPDDRSMSREHLENVVSKARRLGYATEIGENEPGVACVGFAVLRGSIPVAAISITTLVSRLTQAAQRELVELTHAVVTPLLPDGLALTQPVRGPAGRN